MNLDWTFGKKLAAGFTVSAVALLFVALFGYTSTHQLIENDRWVLRVGCQGVIGLRGGLARDVLNVPTDKVRVLTGNVGGSFGMKSQVYPEYGPLLLAAKTLGRPVKWTDERSESFLSDHHGRDHQRVAELALDKDGRFLAVRLTGTGNAGAYIYPPMPATTNSVKNLIDVYATPAMEMGNP